MPPYCRSTPARREARCRACYRLRLEETARVAAERGFEGIGTTLSVSPYQYTQVIREEVERAAAQAGVASVFEDFRPYYDEATRESRELGMYRQNFCGCRISDLEAAAERAERKEQRAAAKPPNVRPTPTSAQPRKRTRGPQSRTSSLRQKAGTQARYPKSPARTGEIAATPLTRRIRPLSLAHCTRKRKTASKGLASISQSKEPGALTRFPHRASPRANKNAFRFSLPEKRKAFDQTPIT